MKEEVHRALNMNLENDWCYNKGSTDSIADSAWS
jgi:hypothetical protein